MRYVPDFQGGSSMINLAAAEHGTTRLNGPVSLCNLSSRRDSSEPDGVQDRPARDREERGGLRAGASRQTDVKVLPSVA